jgi:hypothetical protein
MRFGTLSYCLRGPWHTHSSYEVSPMVKTCSGQSEINYYMYDPQTGAQYRGKAFKWSPDLGC